MNHRILRIIKAVSCVIINSLLLVVIWVAVLEIFSVWEDNAASSLKLDRCEIALRLLTPLADAGDAQAQDSMAYIYSFGCADVIRSRADAIYWFQRMGRFGIVAGEKEYDPVSIHLLRVAKDYLNGRPGVKADKSESIIWLKWSSERGNKEADAILEEINR
ncbi:MAG: hypothetical protein LBG61_05535 [Burkholderiales bacterium]|jgi:hypothetical protein|nr:hypothetical protein [Burkholderiales bacterium]